MTNNEIATHIATRATPLQTVRSTFEINQAANRKPTSPPATAAGKWYRETMLEAPQ